MADSAKKPNEAQPLPDVTPPGKSAPSPTSKAVVINNRPLLQDPMMASKQIEVSTEGLESDTASLGASSKKAPPQPSATKSKSEAVVQSKTTKPVTPPAPTDIQPEPDKTEAETSTPPSNAQNDEPTDKKEETDKDTKDTSDAAELNDEAEAEAQAKHDVAIEKVVESKQYFLPINAVERRRSKHFAILGIVVCVLLALAWADVALDAGLIHINGVKPVTHFFSN